MQSIRRCHVSEAVNNSSARQSAFRIPCGRGRRWSPLQANSSFFSGINRLLGNNRDQTKEGNKPDQRLSGNTTQLTGERNAGPVSPPFTVIHKAKDYTLRLYDVYPVVEMEYVRREEGYAALGAYIDGANEAGRRFPHTQPVIMCYQPDGRKVMQMYLATPAAAPDTASAAAAAPEATPPSASSSPSEAVPVPVADLPPAAASASARHQPQQQQGQAPQLQLPAPREAGVRLGVGGGEVVAVAAFEGFITPTAAEAVRGRLVAALERDGIPLAPADAGGRFRCLQYGAVYQLGPRVNELVLQLRA
ncbi:hypothetical protein Agub_g7581 [Astrephomene gubernaculifera]|uniref:SOUL heme-binding protein n=1 Tax=Astrephomene gubernaculifera TaxID=47775 RepID=A0AAD3HMJ7_9CHLO|nr:hypothetical protein Agub_g7581 [Astrephomene gubernaculifera]